MNCNYSKENKFEEVADSNDLDLSPQGITTLQVNITKLCNQSCVHCHVDASPRRNEEMDFVTVNRCLEILDKNDSIETLDITGGAPELHPHFKYFVSHARNMNRHVIIRHNLTVTIDGNPVTGESKTDLPDFFADNKVELISSLPFYSRYLTDRQRGSGVFEKSIKSLKLLNKAGYGINGSGLILNFVYNPVGAYLPPDQEGLESEYKKELGEKFHIYFNNLYTLTNMPINRFRNQLIKKGNYKEYLDKLINRFNPEAALGIMCRNMLSIGYDGKIYDCDFNQMLDMPIKIKKTNITVFDFDIHSLSERKIRFGNHCFGCTAGNGSSCGGRTT